MRCPPAYFPGRDGHGVRCGAEGAGTPSQLPARARSQLPARRTRGVKLVQLVVDQGRVPGAGAGVRWQTHGPACQPAAHPETLQQVAQEIPEQAAGQVQAGGGQGPAQCLKGQPQMLGGLGKVRLWMRVSG